MSGNTNEVISGITDVVGLLIVLSTTILSIVSEVRRMMAKRELDTSDIALRSLVATIRAWGRTEGNEVHAKELVKKIEFVASLNNVEREKVAGVVQDVKKAMEEAGVFDVPAGEDRLRAAARVAEAKPTAKPKAKKG